MNFESLLLKQYNLKESLMESLKTVIEDNPHIPEQTIRGYHQNALPDNNKSDRLLNHVLKLHNAGEITPDRAAELKPPLTALHNTKQLGKLSQLKTLADHTNAITGLEDKTVTKKQKVDAVTPVIFENEHIVVKQHLDHDSAVRGAMLNSKNPMFDKTNEPGKAQWCLSVGGSTGLTHFNNYTKTGKHPLYTITNKKTNRVHALVADPTKDQSNFELRDEKDLNPYRTNAGMHKFMLGHPGIEKSKAGEFLAKISPVAEETRKLLGHNPSAETIHEVINTPNHPAHELLLDHPGVNTNALLNKIIPNKSLSTDLRLSAIQHKSVNAGGLGKINHDHITSILNDPEEPRSIKTAIIRNPGLTKDHVKTILAGNNDRFKNDVLSNPNSPITEHEIHHIVSTSTNSDLLSNALSHPKANVSHVNTLLGRNLMNTDIHHEMSKVPGLTADHITTLLNSKFNTNRSASQLMQSPNFNNSHAMLVVKNKPINTSDNYLRHSTVIDAINHKNANPDVTKAAIDTNEIDHKDLAFTKHGDLFPSVVNATIEYNNPEHLARVANSPVLTSDHINTIINRQQSHAGDRYHLNRARLTLLQRSDIKPEHISNMIKNTAHDAPWELNKAMTDHPRFNADHISQVINQAKTTGDNDLVSTLANHPKLTTDHITDMIKLKDRQLNKQLLNNDKLTPTHLTNILAHGVSENGHAAILNHPSLKSSHLDSIITNAVNTDSDKINQITALNHPKADSSTVDAALKSKVASSLMPYILKHPKLSNSNATTILQGDNEEHKLAVLHKGKHISGTNLALAQTDKSPTVRLAAINHPNVNLSHINTATNDTDNSVKQAALNVKKQRSIA